jgi:hypothetical protein
LNRFDDFQGLKRLTLTVVATFALGYVAALLVHRNSY